MSQIVGIGTDIESVKRFDLKESFQNSNLIQRIFSKQEIEYCLNKANPAQHFCARFCAREAFVKAAPQNHGFGLMSVQTIVEDSKVKLMPNAKYYQYEKVQLFIEQHTIHVSLSHAKQYAQAFVVVTS